MAALIDLDVQIDEKTYPGGPGVRRQTVFEDFHLSVAAGQFLCLFGPSGCGKTTLLNIVAGLDTDYDGYVSLGGSRAFQVGYMFQEPRLFPWRTVRDNIRLALLDRPEMAGDVDRLLDLVGMARFADVFPKQLSAGEARRVALARAFAGAPRLLLLDEPFVSLDDPAANDLRTLLLEIWGEQPTTVMFVTHDLNEALSLADRITLLTGGPARIALDRTITPPRHARKTSPLIDALAADINALRGL